MYVNKFTLVNSRLFDIRNMEQTTSVHLAFLVYNYGLGDKSVNKITMLSWIDLRSVASLLLDIAYMLVNWLELA